MAEKAGVPAKDVCEDTSSESSATGTGENDKEYKRIVKEYHDGEKQYSVYTALAMFFVCVVMGVPIWWKTTSVYRSDLPYTQIMQLSQQKPLVLVETEVVLLEEKKNLEAIRFGETLQKHFSEVLSGSVKVKVGGRMRMATAGEREAFTSMKSITAFESLIERWENDSKSSQTPIKYSLWVIPRGILPADTPLPCAGTRGNVYIEQGQDDEATIGMLKMTLDSLITHPWLDKQYRSEMSHASNEKPDMDRMRALKSSPSYALLFTLLVPEPDRLFVMWDVPYAVKHFLSNLQTELSPYLDLSFKSQVLYHTGISRKPKKRDDGSFYLSSGDLPSLINPIEGRLSSFVSTDPILNFLVYVPTVATSPLHILTAEDTVLPTNAFLSPRWGGFHIYNVNSTDMTSDPEKPVHLDMKKVMGVFLPQIRALVGVRKPPSQIHVTNIGNKGIAGWELQAWLRERCLENIAKANVALGSLSRLVEQVRNMVINDEVGDQVHLSVEKLSESLTLLAAGKLEQAYLSSQLALQSAEKAFFDPTLLELLYFPEDQKFAIYIPLFLPAGLPILGSLLMAYKFYFKKDKSEESSKPTTSPAAPGGDKTEKVE